jgi:hypothetical protein
LVVGGRLLDGSRGKGKVWKEEYRKEGKMEGKEGREGK